MDFCCLTTCWCSDSVLFVIRNIYKHFKFTFCGFGKFLRKNWSDLETLSKVKVEQNLWMGIEMGPG